MIVIVLLILTGYLSKYLNILKENDRVILNNIVVYMAMPSTIFLTIMKNVSPVDLPQFLKLPFLIFLTFIMCGIIGYIIGKLLKLNKQSLGGLILVCALGNTGFLGYPVIYGFYGTEGLTRAIFCDMGSVFASLLLGTYIGIKFGKNENSDTSIIKELLKFPPLMTGVISIILVFFGVSISNFPDFLVKTLNYLSNATIPLIMLSLGLSLSPSSAKFGAIYGIIASIVRMGIAPLLVFIFSSMFLINGLDKNVLILESAMPSAMMSLVFAVLYGLDVKLVASACFITTVLSLILLPIIHNLM
ncbi:Auxin Efflux Carrier [Methanothermococcus okinawensis IH1]|uniref:Auxin Efflux Carrier n=2 Tax=Methanothermococcus okinawensis TaxID=155863 RepID=F8ALN1_METOI|nr:Auxin Efflux Carrier [Methanothermococcus okinawensis IH1]